MKCEVVARRGMGRGVGRGRVGRRRMGRRVVEL
jgi:hypothetical protein